MGGSPAALRLPALLAWVVVRHAFVAARMVAADAVRFRAVRTEGPEGPALVVCVGSFSAGVVGVLVFARSELRA